MSIELNSQQENAISRIEDWLHDYRRTGYPSRQVFRLFGYAGTGKTTLIKEVAGLVGGLVVYAAYTGKAARVMGRDLEQKATTIHSLCYHPVEPSPYVIAQLQDEINRLPAGSPQRDVLKQRLTDACRVSFQLNEDSIAGEARLIVIDECSMVNEELGMDLLGFERPVLVIGDPGQLPPINGHGFFTSQEPDVMLTQIHRQAAENPIIQVATMARQGKPIPCGRYGTRVLKALKKDWINGRVSLSDHLNRYLGMDQVIVGKNATRRYLNRLIRTNLVKPDPKVEWLPTEEDKIIIRHNYHKLGLLNGDFVTLKDIEWKGGTAKRFDATIVKEDGEEVQVYGKDNKLPIYAGRFMDHYDYQEGREGLDFFHAKGAILADFGYVLTAHTAQGSQWRSVLVVDERMKNTKEDYGKWLYTSVTRAEKMLMILG